jgi:uncharacterized alpha-E superfamily protein
MSNDTKIADSICVAVEQAVERAEEVRGPLNAAMRNEIRAAYLSGMSQGAHVLVKHDGGITPHQIQRALSIVGSRLGFEEDSPG